MSELEKIQRYIDSTNLPSLDRYEMKTHDMIVLMDEIEGNWNRIMKAFEYGLAKGWRAAKASAKK